MKENTHFKNDPMVYDGEHCACSIEHGQGGLRAPSVFKPEVKLPNNLKSPRAEPSGSSANKILAYFQS
jgi:hypothetical protein